MSTTPEQQPPSFSTDAERALVEAMVRSYLAKLTRRCAPFLALMAAIGLVLAFVPGVNPPGAAVGSGATGGREATGSSTGSAAQAGTSTTQAGAGGATTGGSLAGTEGTGPETTSSGYAADGVAVSGVRCAPGVRQVTWSHYAPDCVPAWHGNNGGATSHGVTANTITVTYRISNSGEASAVNAVAQGAFPSQQQVLTDIETYVNYFNTQFELYGRKVVIVPFTGQGDWVEELQDQDLQGAQADAVTAYDDGAFADISQAIDVTTEPYAQDLAQEHVVSIGGVVSSQQFLQENAPYVYTVVPTLNDLGDFEGSLVCQRMAGLPAIFAGDSDFQHENRVFGIISPDTPDYEIGANIVVSDLKACGADVGKVVDYSLDIASLADQDTAIMAEMKAAGVTTVVCAICDDISPVFLTSAANSQDYYPEWIDVDDGDEYGQLYQQAQWEHALGPGISTPVPSTTEAYKVFELADPGGTPAETTRLDIDYLAVMQLFDALQAAGPDLNPQTFEQAMFGLPSSLSGGDSGTWQFGPDVFSPQADYPLAFYDPDVKSPLNGQAGSWQSCAGTDGDFRNWLPASGYGPAHTQLSCFGP